MLAKCTANCNLVRIKGMRLTCPHCRARLKRPTPDELENFGNMIITRARAARAAVQACDDNPVLKLMGFMAVVEGRNISQREAEQMLGLDSYGRKL